MKDVVIITKVEHIRDHRLRISFSDGSVNEINLGPFITKALNPMTSKYKDIKLFKKFTLEGGELHWNDLEMCFPMDDLYSKKIIK